MPVGNNKLTSEDYYVNEQGYRVFTEKYHLKRGYCCTNGCKHCPYGFRQAQPDRPQQAQPDRPRQEKGSSPSLPKGKGDQHK